MARFYQNVLTGQQVEVKTFDEEDFYLDNPANWVRVKALSSGYSPASQAASRLAAEKENNEEASEAGRELQAAKKTAKKKV
jgi:hypothetical protein